MAVVRLIVCAAWTIHQAATSRSSMRWRASPSGVSTIPSPCMPPRYRQWPNADRRQSPVEIVPAVLIEGPRAESSAHDVAAGLPDECRADHGRYRLSVEQQFQSGLRRGSRKSARRNKVTVGPVAKQKVGVHGCAGFGLHPV